ncbi:MAG TPA: hypothetical protein VJB61_11200, partial [Actinomycetota bacterium]
MAVLGAAAAFGAARPSRPWLWALAVGLWIPALGIILRHNPTALIALVPAFLGAFAGAGARRLLAWPDGAAGAARSGARCRARGLAWRDGDGTFAARGARA